MTNQGVVVYRQLTGGLIPGDGAEANLTDPGDQRLVFQPPYHFVVAVIVENVQHTGV